MTVRLALLRHGETAWSRDKRLQGRTDVPLSEAGRARLARRRLPQCFADAPVLTSPLARCRQSAQALGRGDALVEPRLVEMDWGDWEGRTLADLRGELGEAMAQNEARGFDFRPARGESPREVLQRVRPWLAQVAGGATDTVALTHRGVIRVVFAWATGWDMLARPPARLDWGALQVFTLTPEGLPVVAQLNLALPVVGSPEASS